MYMMWGSDLWGDCKLRKVTLWQLNRSLSPQWSNEVNLVEGENLLIFKSNIADYTEFSIGLLWILLKCDKKYQEHSD